MARKFIDLDEAAKMLGVSPETLREMRDRQKVHGYRDGASWKFKPEDIERLIADREAAEQEGEFAEVDEDPDSILLSEVELGQSDESTSSTIIGGSGSRASSESDIQIAPPKQDSDVDLDSALALDPSGGSDVLGGSDVVAAGSGVSPTFDELDALDLDLPSAADSGISSKIFSDITTTPASDSGSKTQVGSDVPRPEPSGVAFGSEDDLALGEAPAEEEPAEHDDEDHILASDDGGSAIDLGGDEDDDLVLGGGSAHGDLSRAGDSGISLLDPSDSGLSLESAPLELGGSAVESLELGEEDDMILTEDEAAAASGARAAGVEEQSSDDDFLLTPLEEAGAEDSDSGSQVIALDEDVEFEDAGTSGLETAGGLLEDDLGEGLGAAGALGEAALTHATTQTTAPAGAAHAAAALEAPFTGWNVTSLALCSVLLIVVGMFMFDLLRNMWSWHGTYTVNSTLMDIVLSWFEG